MPSQYRNKVSCVVAKTTMCERDLWRGVKYYVHNNEVYCPLPSGVSDVLFQVQALIR